MSHLRGHAVDMYALRRVAWMAAEDSAHMLGGLRKAAWAGMIEVRHSPADMPKACAPTPKRRICTLELGARGNSADQPRQGPQQRAAAITRLDERGKG